MEIARGGLHSGMGNPSNRWDEIDLNSSLAATSKQVHAALEAVSG